MAKATFNLDNFRSQISTGSLARTNRFEVVINSPPLLWQYHDREISLLVESANLPLLNIAAKPFKIFGPSYQRPYTSEYGGEGVQMVFHVDRDMKVKRFFDDWMHLIIDPNDFTVGYQKDYITTIDIHQLDEQNNITYAVQLLEAFPRSMNMMDLNNASSNQTHRLSMLFAYRYWKRKTTNTLDTLSTGNDTAPRAIPRPITTPQVPSRVLTSNPNKPFDRYTSIGVPDENGDYSDITGP